MILKWEIKDFVKKVLILWILLSLLINLFVTYLSSLGSTSFANSNDTKFKRADVSYPGATGVAVSFNIWTKFKQSQEIPVNLFTEVMPISYILANKNVARDKIIISNMMNLNEYLNILKTDINSILDSSSDREAMLTSFIDQLEFRYKLSISELKVLQQQAKELEITSQSSVQRIESLKTDLTNSYKKLDYDKTQSSVDEYLKQKDSDTYAKTYLIFIQKFINSYTILNNYNKVLLDTLINNKEALIKKSTVVLPDSGNTLLNKLNLLKTEVDYKAGK
ncbi:MAG: hypothetical protein ACD_49C00073G0002 [uncultured bacterium (gcode 4)]|uniref:Uncharacterized protein n=1 Tax=uncultured bacterium (gcode 4) TaxID=1234023 RepID=K2BUL9_9BACT|nr:MAG: hypothetical protein ACD_49C00073G0002 [uncultured bacterium (gcode 4)]